jgi:hypothetical protein
MGLRRRPTCYAGSKLRKAGFSVKGRSERAKCYEYSNQKILTHLGQPGKPEAPQICFGIVWRFQLRSCGRYPLIVIVSKAEKWFYLMFDIPAINGVSLRCTQCVVVGKRRWSSQVAKQIKTFTLTSAGIRIVSTTTAVVCAPGTRIRDRAAGPQGCSNSDTTGLYRIGSASDCNSKIAQLSGACPVIFDFVTPKFRPSQTNVGRADGREAFKL